LIKAKTTMVAVRSARAMAENRTMESFRIRWLPNLFIPGLCLETGGFRLD
jgi:hypothetical protein